MKSTNETGHPKNVANFSTLINSCESQNGRYIPSNPNLSLTSMKALCTKAQNAVGMVNKAQPVFNNASNAREIAFKPLSKLITRAYNYAVSTGIPKQTLANLVTIKRKIQGVRATRKLTEEEKAALKAEGKEVKEVSASQRSFDNMINNFDMFIQAVTAIPEYQPNEEDLKTTALNDFLANLRETNDAAVKSFNPILAARAERNALLYTPGSGLVDIALAAKAYIKSVDTVQGTWYKQIAGLKFTRI